MSGADLTQLLYCFIMLSVFLLIGTLLRAVIPAFQKCFLPASVIGGFIGLLVGPNIWSGIPFPAEWIKTWSSLPGILVVPVVASVPLGMAFGKKGGKGAGKTSANIIKMFCVLTLASTAQIIIGMFTNGLFSTIMPELGLYETFGYELTLGYAGGHGTAGVLGSYLQGIGYAPWEIAQGVTTTTATFGLVGGMIIGIIYINIMARRGKTTLLKKPGDIPADMARGIQADVDKQVSAGKDTTFSSSIESLTFHLSIILAGVGIAYVLMNWVKANKVPIINQIPIWAYAIVVMFGVNFLIQKLGLGKLVDTKTKSKITGTLSDYAITAAIASMPVKAVLQYVWPILFMCLLGYVITFLIITVCCKRFFSDSPVERSMAVWGSSTGVFLNGVMLLKICDPEFQLPVLNDYSVGFSFTSILGFIMMPLTVSILINQGLLAGLLVQFGFLLAFFILMLAANGISKKLDKAGGGGEAAPAAE